MAFADRIKSFDRIPAGRIVSNLENWATHSETQSDALDTILSTIGFAGALLVFTNEDGLPELIDGHLRLTKFQPDELVPCLTLDVSREEARVLLATVNPIAAMVGTDPDKLTSLLDNIDTDNDELSRMLDDLRPAVKEAGDLEEVDTTRPAPVMAWVLIGIPTVRFGEVSPLVEQIAKIKGVLCETAVSNG